MIVVSMPSENRLKTNPETEKKGSLRETSPPYGHYKVYRVTVLQFLILWSFGAIKWFQPPRQSDISSVPQLAYLFLRQSTLT